MTTLQTDLPTLSDGSPMSDRYDAIVVGAGSGGLTVAVGLSILGKSVALIEASNIGGDCTNVGCIPSKSLLHRARHQAGAAGADILAEVRAKRDRLRDEEAHEYAAMENIDLVFARATIESPTSVRLTPTATEGSFDTTVSAENIIIATGARPRPIPIEGLPAERLLTNDNFFEAADLPKRIAILGAGAIGLELGYAANLLGSEVTILEAGSKVLPQLPNAAGVEVSRALTSQSIDVRTQQTAKRYDPDSNALHIGPLDGDETDVLPNIDAVLVAVGRIPNSDSLGLDAKNVRIETDRGFIVTDNKGRTNVGSIWAVGDVTTRSRTTHGANAWGRRITKAIAFPYVPIGSKPIIPAAIFAQPEIATIGQHPEFPGDDVNRIVLEIPSTDRAYTDDVQDGVIILDVRRLTGKVMAVTVVGPHAGELIGIVSMAMTNDIPLHKWYSVVWAYPTYSGAIGKVVDLHMSETLTNIKRESRRWFRGSLRRLRR